MKSIFKSRQRYKNYFYIISFKINYFFQIKSPGRIFPGNNFTFKFLL